MAQSIADCGLRIAEIYHRATAATEKRTAKMGAILC
jgi:hypothetical protein